MLLKVFIVVAAMLTLLAPTKAFAETPVPPVPEGYSTVHIVFVTPYESPQMGEVSDKAVPRAAVGDLVLTIESVHPISISIDGEFVGHAMAGLNSIKPVFVLGNGKHKFEFSCDGFKTTKVDLTVIGTGSKQYLIVKLPPATDEKSSKATTNPKRESKTEPRF